MKAAVTARSARPEVRNPVLSLPALAQLQALAPEARAALRAILIDISAQALVRAEGSWRQKKAPMAAYWKVVSVYARHIARALSRAAALQGVGPRDKPEDDGL